MREKGRVRIRDTERKEAKEKYPSVQKWGVIGFCWGGKVATLLSLTGDVDASAQCHPAMLNSEDASKIKIPHMCLASKDEDPQVVQKYKSILSNEPKSHVETFSNDIHGWMAARSNLENKNEADSFHRGYQQAIDFFKNALTA